MKTKIKSDDIINKHALKQPETRIIPGGATYLGQRTAMFQKMCEELESNGYKIGTDCGTGAAEGFAILYIY